MMTKKNIELDELEWRIEYLKSQYSLDEQIRDDEENLSEDEKEFFNEEMIYIKEWIKELKDEKRKIDN